MDVRSKFFKINKILTSVNLRKIFLEERSLETLLKVVLTHFYIMREGAKCHFFYIHVYTLPPFYTGAGNDHSLPLTIILIHIFLSFTLLKNIFTTYLLRSKTSLRGFQFSKTKNFCFSHYNSVSNNRFFTVLQLTGDIYISVVSAVIPI